MVYVTTNECCSGPKAFTHYFRSKSRKMVADTKQCLSFESTNAFRQEYNFDDITKDVFGDDFSYGNSSLMDAGGFVENY